MMPRKLRSDSNIKSQNSGQTARRDTQARTAESPSVSKVMRPRKSRKVGRVTGGTEASNKSQNETGKAGSAPPDKPKTVRYYGLDCNYQPPGLAPEAPSYADSPWSGVSSNTANPILGTMRPLGAVPTDADRVKVGLAPTGGQPNVTSGNALPSLLEQAIATPAAPVLDLDQVWAWLVAIPVPTSSDVDVDEMKCILEETLALAVGSQNTTVVHGLLRLWEASNSDPFILSILGSVLRNKPKERESVAFQALLRYACSDILTQDPTTVNGARRGSESSTSSLSSAKSLDAETFAPAIANGGGKHMAKNAKGLGKSIGQKRPREDDLGLGGADELTLTGDDLPKVIESSVRSSMPSDSAQHAPESDGAQTTGATKKIVSSNKRRRISEKRRQSPAESENAENNDFCHQCSKTGELLCCDGCEKSFHFECLVPELDPKKPPKGDWYCPKCSMSMAMGGFVDKLNKSGRKDFVLPLKLRNHFMDARSGEKGAYEDAAPLPRNTTRPARGSRVGQYDDENLRRTHEIVNGMERPIMCYGCGRVADGIRPTLQCDYCPLSFHLDCLDPPMAKPPYQIGNSERARQNWMCPNHSYHDLVHYDIDEDGNARAHQIRRPRNPRLIDVAVLPNEEEAERAMNETDEGVVYRAPASYLSGQFITQAKWENYHADVAKLLKRQVKDYFEYTKAKYNQVYKQACDFYAARNQPPPYQPDEATMSIYNSRTEAERDCVMNLTSLSQSNGSYNRSPDTIGLLVDQLKASAPELPKPQNEIESLRELQALIEQRIQHLAAEGQDGASPMVLD